MHPGDNALGRRLGPPDPGSSAPRILRGMVLIIPRAQAIRGPQSLGAADGSGTASGEAEWGPAAALSKVLT